MENKIENYFTGLNNLNKTYLKNLFALISSNYN